MASAYSTSTLREETAHTEIAQPPLQLKPIQNEATPAWNLATRIAFRFFFVYFPLYGFPFIFRMIPGLNYLVDRYTALLHLVVPWVGSHILHLGHTITVFTNGSGDTTYDYVETLCFLVVAGAATLVWSVLDRKRANYQRLHQWLRLSIRFVLGFNMLIYGAAKVIPIQMSAPILSKLLQPFGDSSPMGLLWTFIGASGPYQTFCGASEMLGGILLFVPWFTTLGALVCVGVLTNVFMLNMCYDVPVKLFSFHLLLMAIFLAAPELRSLSDLFLFQRKARLSNDAPLFRRKWLNRTAIALQLLCGLVLASLMLYGSHQDAKELAVKPPNYGIWSVEEYAVDGNLRPRVLADATRWQRVIFDYPGRLSVQPMEGPQERFMLKLDEAKKSFTLTRRGDANWKADFSYRDAGTDVLILEGQFDGHKVNATLHREEEPKFLLTSRGFHWINEYPFQR